MKAMILAAGLGTRLKPFTDTHPKAMALINHKTIVQRNIEYLASFGITEVILNVHHFGQQLMDFVKENNGFGSSVSFSDESAEVLETGGGLRKAAWFFESDRQPFVLMNVDILTDMDLDQMIRKHMQQQPLATLAVTNRSTSRHFLFDKQELLCGWANAKTGETKISRKTEGYVPKAFSGIHVISPDIFPLMKQEGKFSMVEVYLDLSRDHRIIAYDHTGSRLIDVGKPERVAEAEKMFY